MGSTAATERWAGHFEALGKKTLEGFPEVRAASVDLASRTATVAAPEQADPQPWLEAIGHTKKTGQAGESMEWVATVIAE
ncbi:MAG TPA: heavy metal-associated domain-containing protein [Polyangiaceae bacterium]|nr:heavy metal-associated domain-containing protein [Polyangiaceae bacterium]